MTSWDYNLLTDSFSYNFWDINVWVVVLQLAIILFTILIANTIRRKVKLIRNSLLPTSVIAGVMIFILKFIPAFSEKIISNSFMEMLTYHSLGLGFVALSLKTGIKTKDKNKMIIMDSGIITVGGYLIQAIVGLAISITLFVTIMPDFFYAAGLLLPMGFGQGTGQALNFGKVYSSYGFENGTAFGLSIAAVGFFVACIVGVVYLNILRKQGKLAVQQQRKEEANSLSTDIYAEDEAPLSDSIDKLTIQMGFIFGVYLITYLFILAISTLATKFAGDFGVNTLRPLFWGFNFLFGSIFAILIKKFVHKLRVKKIMKHTYLNNFMMNRISGLFFDIMIVAGIAAIDWKNLIGVFWPLILTCSLGTVATFAYIKYVCHKIYPDYEYESFFAIFGMLTGTASTGMILLREIDPNYETPAADNLVLQQLPAILFGAPLLLLMTYAAQSLESVLLVFGIVILLFIIYNLILLRKHIFRINKKSSK